MIKRCNKKSKRSLIWNGGSKKHVYIYVEKKYIYIHTRWEPAVAARCCCKIKVCFDSYSVMNNWHMWLLVLRFGDYRQSGFGDNQFSGDEQGLMFCRDQSDRAVVAGQTGSCVAVRPVGPRSDCPALCRFQFQVVSLDIRDCFMVMASRWILYVCNTVVC